MATQAAERTRVRSAEFEQAARRLNRPATRGALALKRAADRVLAAVLLTALLPLLVLVALLLMLDRGPWLERRLRLGRDARLFALARFRALPGGVFGRALERLGVREVPLLWAVLRGRMSFVGPRPLPPGSGHGHGGPRQLMAPGLLGPAQRWARCPETASSLDDAYVRQWSLLADVRLMAGIGGRSSYPAVSSRTTSRGNA